MDTNKLDSNISTKTVSDHTPSSSKENEKEENKTTGKGSIQVGIVGRTLDLGGNVNVKSVSSGYLGGVGAGGSGSIGLGGDGSGASSMITTSRSYYKPISQPRNNLRDLQKATGISLNAQMSDQQGGSMVPLIRGDSVALQSNVNSMRKGRAQEKRDMQDLNERFASYIEKARFLEAQNKQLVGEIEQLKGGSVKDTSKIKEIYEVEIRQLRNLLNDSEKNRAPLEVQIDSLEYELDDLRKRLMLLEDINGQYKSTIDKQRQELGNFEGELVELRRFKNTRNADVSKEKEEVKSLRDELKKLRQDYEREALAHITVEHELQNLRETMDFEKQIHETEVKELTTVAYRDPTKENMMYWQSEMGRALRDIQTEYENKLSGIKQEMEASYGLQMQEIRTSKTRDNVETTHYKEENSRIKSQIQSMRSRIADLERQNAEYEHNLNMIRGNYEETQRSLELKLMSLQEQLTETQQELSAALTELQSLLDAKLGLELEIAAYGKLLEFEESRVNSNTEGNMIISQFSNFTAGGGVVVSGGGSSGSRFGGGSSGSGIVSGSGGSGFGTTSGSVGGVLGGYETKKMQSRRTTKGNISIAESDESGLFIILENMSTKKEILSGMKIKRNIDGKSDSVVFSIPDNTELNGGEKITIWANGKKTGKGKELEINEKSWGFGENVVTILVDKEDEEKATLNQEVSK